MFKVFLKPLITLCSSVNITEFSQTPKKQCYENFTCKMLQLHSNGLMQPNNLDYMIIRYQPDPVDAELKEFHCVVGRKISCWERRSEIY